MTLSEIITALKRYGFDDTDPLTTWINAAYHEFEDYVEWPFLEVLYSSPVASGGSTVNLPVDFARLISIRVKDQSTNLQYFDTRTWWREVATWGAVSSVPDKFTIYNTNILQIHPLPTANILLDIHYIRALSDMAVGTEQPQIPVKYHYALVRGAAAYALQAESNEERAKTAYDEFQGAMDVAAGRESSKQTGVAITVQDSQGYTNAY